MSKRLHFVGVTRDQYWSALRVFGHPDVVHERALWSNLGEIPKDDYVVLGKAAFSVPPKWKRKKRPHLTAH